MVCCQYLIDQEVNQELNASGARARHRSIRIRIYYWIVPAGVPIWGRADIGAPANCHAPRRANRARGDGGVSPNEIDELLKTPQPGAFMWGFPEAL